MITHDNGKSRKMTDKEEMAEYQRIKSAEEKNQHQYRYSKRQIDLIPAMTPEEIRATISIDDTVYFESVDDPNIRIKANFRGWSGNYACVVYNHGHQIMIERNRIFKTDIPDKENGK